MKVNDLFKSKKVLIIGGIILFLLLIGILGGENPSQYQKQIAEVSQPLTEIPQQPTQPNTEKPQEEIQTPLIEEEKPSPQDIPQEEAYSVVKVIDGDTIKLENGEVVRYIGIDTPETVHPSKPVQCFGKESSDKNKELVEGKLVKLEKDITDRDKYGRLLRYVWVGDLFVNDYLVRQGYAYAYTYPPDVKYSNQFVEAQKEARENNRGLWNLCQQATEPATPPTTPPTPTSTPDNEGIICSSNVYNCSNFSTHAEAQHVFEVCGGVNNDIHKLDSDKDGLACETLP